MDAANTLQVAQWDFKPDGILPTDFIFGGVGGKTFAAFIRQTKSSAIKTTRQKDCSEYWLLDYVMLHGRQACFV
jgi:hypothetical protein